MKGREYKAACLGCRSSRQRRDRARDRARNLRPQQNRLDRHRCNPNALKECMPGTRALPQNMHRDSKFDKQTTHVPDAGIADAIERAIAAPGAAVVGPGSPGGAAWHGTTIKPAYSAAEMEN